MRWNFSSRARELSGGDALVLSIPKSGRTWVRTFLSAYFARKIQQPFAIEITDTQRPEIPRIVFSHDRFEQLTKGRGWDRVRGKYLVPRSQLRVPIILLARDPRDAFVSYFIQKTRRQGASEVQKLTADALLRHRRFGIEAMVEVMNEWLRDFGRRTEFTLMRYEDLRAQPREKFRELLTALGESEINQAAFEHALEFSDIENMRKLEASGGFANKILRPRDRDDPESFKVRRGKVGGFGEYLSPASQEFAQRAVAQLDPRFNYR